MCAYGYRLQLSPAGNQFCVTVLRSKHVWTLSFQIFFISSYVSCNKFSFSRCICFPFINEIALLFFAGAGLSLFCLSQDNRDVLPKREGNCILLIAAGFLHWFCLCRFWFQRDLTSCVLLFIFSRSEISNCYIKSNKKPVRDIKKVIVSTCTYREMSALNNLASSILGNKTYYVHRRVSLIGLIKLCD